MFVGGRLVGSFDAKGTAERNVLLIAVSEEPKAHFGPVWLDRVDAASLALHGFGADIHLALARSKARKAGRPRKAVDLRRRRRSTRTRPRGATAMVVFHETQ